MMQPPFKIAKHNGDIEKGGQVLQDMHPRVGGHISQLPDEILECILDKLKLRDAVRAGLVSSRWRHLVLSRDCLVFRLSNMFNIEEASRKKCNCPAYEERFVRAVYQFIASYRGARIKCFIRFCLKSDSACAVSNWLRFALDLGVEVLNVVFYCEYFKSILPLRSIPSKIPIEFSPSKQPVVKYLTLSNCDAPGVLTRSLFSQLEVLRFHNICLDSHDMESMLSGLVNLKKLAIRQCKLPRYLCLNSFTNLEGVRVWFCSRLEKIDVANIKLKTLSVLCRRRVSLGLTRTPNLSVLSYTVHDRGIRHIFSKLPEILPRLRSLSVHAFYNWIEYMPENVAIFSRLRKLTLGLDHTEEDITCKIVQLLKSCPLLCWLDVLLSAREDNEHGKLESIEYRHAHLKWFKVYGFVGTKYQIESCKYLLKLAPRPKWMKLTFALPVVLSHVTRAGHRTDSMNEKGRESVVNELKAFSNLVNVNNVNVLFV